MDERPKQIEKSAFSKNSKERRGSSTLLHNNGLALIHHPTMPASGHLSLQRSLSPHLLELIDFAAEPAWRSCYWTVDFLRAAYWLWGCSPLNPCSYWIGSIDTWRRNSIRSNSTTPPPPPQTLESIYCVRLRLLLCYMMCAAPRVHCVWFSKLFAPADGRHMRAGSSTDVIPTRATFDISEKRFGVLPNDKWSCRGAIHDRVMLAAA